MTKQEELDIPEYVRKYFSDDEFKVLLIDDFLRYFLEKNPDNRIMRRRFYSTMEILADIMVKQGYWGRED